MMASGKKKGKAAKKRWWPQHFFTTKTWQEDNKYIRYKN